MQNLPTCEAASPPWQSLQRDSLGEFRRRHALTSTDLARLLDVPLETLRRYERDGAPSWLSYALVGLEYVASDAVTGPSGAQEASYGD